MFEKEAEEYATRDVFFDGVPEPVINHQRKEDWQKGAEFGYNKANKWHFVKDELPKENQLVLIYRENSRGANIALDYWYKSYVNDKVIAWKEIVLPKEIK